MLIKKRYLKNTSGFTLIELLIVITLTSVLFTLLFGTYLQLQKTIRKQNIRSNISQKMMESVYILSSDIHNLYYEAWNQDFYFIGNKKIISGNHQIDTIKFPTSHLYSNTSTLQANVHTVMYYGGIDEDTNKTVLYRKEDPFLDYAGKNLDTSSSNNSFKTGLAIPILKNIKNFIVQYSNNNETYEDNWDITKQSKPPKFIKITLEWEESGLDRKFTFTVSPIILSH